MGTTLGQDKAREAGRDLGMRLRRDLKVRWAGFGMAVLGDGGCDEGYEGCYLED